MLYCRNVLSTICAFGGTVEVAPVHPAYVINAETIKQCIVGNFVKPLTKMEV